MSVIENTEAASLADKYAAGGMDKLAAELEQETYIKAASAQRKGKDKGKAKAKGKRMGKGLATEKAAVAETMPAKQNPFCCSCLTKATI